VAACRDAVAAEPRWAQAHLELGEALADSGAWSEARAAFEQTVRLRPDSAEARGNLVIALARLGLTSDAVAALEGLAHHRPHDVEVHLALGTLYRRAHRNDDAVRSFRWAVRLPEPPRDVRCRLGEALLGEAAWANVLASYHHAARVQGRTPVPAPQWHSPLNHHPTRTTREFRSTPRPARAARRSPALRSLLDAPLHAVGAALSGPLRLGRRLVARPPAPRRTRH
jgi:cytochrome c-type biogenesis protein CcmH/NrfG